ncbi:FAD-dependent oxidoreductase [Leucobacter sp. wl10]|uniref:FAD-dependent oxidoreductase n=1 Tax=Leucobacter sp. wl10 TaxID=2304677 RepID=UPI0013C2C83C|nr:FAD-dependent oxidoreductase [Leucobacter sp. wl10]
MKIAVVGLGAIGAQVLWQLSRRAGVEAHGFESGYIGHPRAGAGGEGRLFRNLELTTGGYLPIIKRSDEIWRELEGLGRQRLRRMGGVLLIGGESNVQVRHAISAARGWDVEHEVLDTAALRRRFPQFSVTNDDIGVWDVGGGVISPELSIAVAVEQAGANGALVNASTQVSGVEETANGVRLVLASGERREFDRVVVACGGWTTKLVPELKNWIVARRLTSAWYAGRDDDGLRELPPFMRAAPGYCYGIPNEDQRLVKLGLGFNDHLPVGDPDRAPRALTHADAQAEVERFSWILRDLLPGLRPNPVRIETFIESYTRTMHEFMGVPEGRTNTVVLGGFSGHGFKMAPALGELGAQLVLTGETAIDLGFLADAQPAFSITDVETGETTHNAVVASHDSPIP